MHILKNTLFGAVVLAACSAPPADPGPPPLLAAPAAGEGLQVRIGPFSVPPSDEIQVCQTLKLDNDQPIAIHSLEAKKTLGSHHLIIFKSDESFPDQTFPCWGTVNFDQWSFVFDVQQNLELTWTLPEGDAFVLKPHQQIMIQAHYVNATTVQAPDGGMAFVNLYTMPMADVQRKVGSEFTVNTNIYIPPHSSFTNERECEFSQAAELIGMTGHFHSRGTSFKVWSTTRFGGAFEKIYESDMPLDGPFKTWDPPYSSLSGVKFSCSYYNKGDTPVVWGSHADVQEHCNLFFHYVPVEAGAEPMLTCRNGSGGW